MYSKLGTLIWFSVIYLSLYFTFKEFYYSAHYGQVVIIFISAILTNLTIKIRK